MVRSLIVLDVLAIAGLMVPMLDGHMMTEPTK